MINVGSKIFNIVAIVSVVGLILYGMIQYIQQAEQDKITIDIIEETQEKEKVIKDAVKKSKPVDRNDATDSLQYLRDRQSR